MKDFFDKIIGEKRLLILGYGREGESTYNLLRKLFPEMEITIADIDESIRNKTETIKKDKHLRFKLGKDYLKNISDFDLVIKTPGISLNNKEIVFNRENITSQTALFLELYRDQAIGITGTKGKSTTSSLIYHIIHSVNKNSILVGNIGIPPFDMIEKIDENTIIVCELSSHQLEYARTSPHISVLLNLFQEHLDHYKSFADYQLAKLNIARYQNKNDFFIFHSDDINIKSLVENYSQKGQQLRYGFEEKTESAAFMKQSNIWIKHNDQGTPVYEITDKLQLKGNHNILNIMAAILTAELVGISFRKIQHSINEFKGLAHRIEYVGRYKEIDFYNDSIATIPEATIEAVKALENVNTIILGGFDRGIDYSDFAVFLTNTQIEHFIFIEEAGLRILSELIKCENINSQEYIIVNSLEEAVSIAFKETQKNKICLLSPAAASYGMFKNFEERGILFKNLIKEQSNATNENSEKM
jgi:UDP-N-acetylmuramoylalanine--D-glutamate ligase